MKRNTKIAYTAMFTALVTVGTLIAIPLPATKGYFNTGDAFIMLCATLLGPIPAMIAGGVGAALGDIILSYFIYAPFTLVIKAVEGLLAAFLFRALTKAIGAKRLYLSAGISYVVAGLEMVFGYFIAECILYGYGGAVVAIVPNILQGLLGVVVALLLLIALDKTKITERLFHVSSYIQKSLQSCNDAKFNSKSTQKTQSTSTNENTSDEINIDIPSEGKDDNKQNDR